MKRGTFLRRLVFGLAGFAFALPFPSAGAATDELVEKRLTVKWNPVMGGGYRGVWNTGKGMELISFFPVSENTPVAVVEAENASVVLFNADGGIRQDGDASGDAYAASPKTMELFFQLQKPADYDVWYNVRFAANVEEVTFLQGLDASLGGSVGWVTLKKEQPGWGWLKGNLRHSFKRVGMIELQTTGIPPGIEIDRIVLATDPQWQPGAESLNAATALPSEPWTSGSLDSGDLFFAQVDRWGKVACAMEKNQGSAAFQYSLDGGKTWNATPADGELGAVPAKGDGSDRIRFKINLGRKKAAGSPTTSPSLELVYRTSADSVFPVEDSVSRLFFARKTGALCGIVNKATGHALTPVDYPAPVFTLCLKKPGFQDEKEWVTLTALEAECREAGVAETPPAGYLKKLRFSYRVTRPEGTVDVTVHASFREPGESLWECEATNSLDGMEICKLVYPVLDRVGVGDDPKTNNLLINGAYLVKNPAMFGHFLYWWPGNSYPMLDVSSGEEGLSLIAHDPTLRCTGISCMGQQDSVQLRLHKIVDVKKGQTFRGAPNLVRVHRGDWREACLLERPWANQAFPLATSPLWAEELDVFAAGGWPVPPWNQWGKMAANIRSTTQAPLLGLWNFQVPGTCWTVPHPNPILGDAEDLRYAVREVQKAGIRIILYIQSVLVDGTTEGSNPDEMVGYIKRKNLWKGWELPEKGFVDKNRVRDAAGTKVAYTALSDDTESVMNHAAAGFQNYKYHWAVERFGAELGLNGIYWDSDSGHVGGPAWGNSDLYGFDPGMTGKGAQDIQRKIRAAYQKTDPACVFVGEGPPNVLMGGVRDFSLDNVQSLWPFRMLFPRMKVLLGSANAADPTRRKAFLSGVRFDGIDTAVPLQAAFLTMRRQVKQYLYSADFRDELGLTIRGDGVEAKLFVLDPGRNDGVLFNILNEKKVADGGLIFTPPERRQYAHGWIVDADGHDQSFTQFTRLDTGEYRISLPAVAAAHILLFDQLEPRATASCADELVAGGKITVKVGLQSLDGDRKKGTVRVTTPPGFAAERVAYDIGGKDGHAGVSLDVPISANVDVPSRIVDFPIVVSAGSVGGGLMSKALAFWKGGRQHEFAKVHSAYVHDPVRVTLDWVGPDKLLVRLVNRLAQPCTGSFSLAAAKGDVRLAKGDLKMDYALAANETRDLPVEMAGAEQTREPWAFRGELICRASVPGSERSTERKAPVYQRFWPIIPNGSLELYRFREGAPEKEHYNYSKNLDKMEAFERNLPDYWWGILSDRSPRLSTRPGVSLDSQEAGDGVRSLKLAPDTIFSAYVPIALVTGRSYRLRMKTKWSAPSPRNHVAFVRYNKDGSPLTFGVLGPKADAAVGRWHQLETTFKAPADSGTLYFYSGKGTTVWFDDLSVVPLDGEGKAQ